MKVSLDGIGRLGIVKDLKPDTLPPTATQQSFAWSDGHNVVFRNDQVEKLGGYRSVFGTPGAAPKFILPVRAASGNYYWLYAGDAKVYATDGVGHYNITRAAGDYTGGAAFPWQSTVLNGIPLLNNGVDLPQYWLPQSTSQPLQNLSAWPSNYRAGVIRSMSNFLVAFSILKDNVRYPTLVKWSHGASPGTLPSSWDETNPALDAGEWSLSSRGDAIVDAVKMGPRMLIYRELSIDIMGLSNDTSIFAFDDLSLEAGVPAKNCVVNIEGGKHVIFTGEDLAVFNGQTLESVLTARQKALVRQRVNPAHYKKSFVFANLPEKQVWLCLPTAGSTPDFALVWNWYHNTVGFVDLPGVTCISDGAVSETLALDIWSAQNITWAQATFAWNSRAFDPAFRRMLMASPDSNKLYFLSDAAANGAALPFFVERTGFGVQFNKKFPPDVSSMKLCQGAWIRATGQPGATMQVYFGAQNNSQAPVVWDAPADFTLGSDVIVRPPSGGVSGRLLALRLESSDVRALSIQGIDLEVEQVGDY